jgi:hypothetical protein
VNFYFGNSCDIKRKMEEVMTGLGKTGWARVRSLPFFNLTQVRQIMQASDNMDEPVLISDDYSDYDYDLLDQSENREDESKIIFPGIFPFQYQPRIPKPTSSDISSEDDEEGLFTLSGDSLAFTLIYISVFTLTLLYVGVKIARRWREKRERDRLSASDSRLEDGSLALPPCGHPQCARRPNSSFPNSYLPYTGLASALVPEILALERNVLTGSRSGGAGRPAASLPVHSTTACRGRCSHCRSLSRPPPSYTKLFLEDQPPSYTDAMELGGEESSNTCDENKTEDVPLVVEYSPGADVVGEAVPSEVSNVITDSEGIENDTESNEVQNDSRTKFV